MRGGFFRNRNKPPTYKIALLSTLLPGIIHSIGALSICNPGSTKYTNYFLAIKLNSDKLT